MLTWDGAVAWVRRTCGLDDAEQQVQEGPHSFLINMSPPGYQGGATAVVSKRTGEYWYVGSNVNFSGLANATSEEELREVLSAYADLERPGGTIVPSVTRTQLVSWLAERASWQHLDDRVTDLGWMFLVNSQPDEFLDGTGPQDPTAGPIVVVKGSGAVWWLPLSPNLTGALGAASSREFRQEMASAGHPLPAEPNEWLIPWPELPRQKKRELTRELVAEWLADKYGWQHPDDRISDVGWAFSVAEMLIVKRTGGVWVLSSRPELLGARDEHDLYKLMRAALPVFDRERPDDRIPL